MSENSKKVDVMQGGIAFRRLSKLWVNQHIVVSLRTMSNKFGGLGMIHLNSMSLGDRLHHIRRFWGTQTEDSNWIKHVYETFIMDLGLEGNVFTRNDGALECLAEHSWWKNTWHLCYIFNCELVIDPDYMLSRVREREREIKQS